MRPFRIGIIGGVGPRASVLLEQLIIEATPATRDQDHLEVVHFSNPQIPDRTTSLERDGGTSFVAELVRSARLLERAGATVLIIPCHTTHARFREIEAAVTVPIVNLVAETLTWIRETHPTARAIGLLATDGTIRERVYEQWLPRDFRMVTPAAPFQKQIMETIYDIKARGPSAHSQKVVRTICKALDEQGADVVVLGCTELSLLSLELGRSTLPVVDPLRIVAARLVQMRTGRALRVFTPHRAIPA